MAFVPLIGSGFDALNNQRMGWEGFNARVQAENIARANAAERLQNNWLANASQLAQQAQLQDVAAAERGQQTAIGLAEARRRDILAREIRGEEVKLQDRLMTKQQDFAREQAKTKMDYERELFDKQTKLAKDQLDLQGQHLAANYGPAKTAADEAQAKYLQMQADLIDAKAELASEQAKKKPDPTFLMNKQKEAAGLEKMMARVEAERNRTARLAAGLENQAQNAGFVINEDGTIAHPQHEKTWTWKKALSEAKAAADTGEPMTGATAQWGQSFRNYNLGEPPAEAFSAPAETPALAPAPVSAPAPTTPAPIAPPAKPSYVRDATGKLVKAPTTTAMTTFGQVPVAQAPAAPAPTPLNPPPPEAFLARAARTYPLSSRPVGYAGFTPPPQTATVTTPAPAVARAPLPFKDPIALVAYYRSGRMSKTEAQAILDANWPKFPKLVGPEWDFTHRPEDTATWSHINPTLGLYPGRSWIKQTQWE